MGEFNYNEWLYNEYHKDTDTMDIDHKKRYNALLESLRYISGHIKTLDDGKLYCSKRGLDYQEYLETILMDVKKVAGDSVLNKKFLPLTSRTKW